MKKILALYFLAVLALGGCGSRPTPVVPPDIDAAAVGKGALQAADEDGNGQLSSEELAKHIPGILAAMQRFDKNSDGQVSAEEITERIAHWQGLGVGLMTCVAVVKVGDAPLADAEIKLTPEPFMGAAIKPAQGKSREDGTVILKIPDDLLPGDQKGYGMHPGIYRAEVINSPVPIDSDKPVGIEVAPDVVEQQEIVFSKKGG